MNFGISGRYWTIEMLDHDICLIENEFSALRVTHYYIVNASVASLIDQKSLTRRQKVICSFRLLAQKL